MDCLILHLGCHDALGFCVAKNRDQNSIGLLCVFRRKNHPVLLIQALNSAFRAREVTIRGLQFLTSAIAVKSAVMYLIVT